MSTAVNPFKFQTAKMFEKNKSDGNVDAGGYLITDASVHLDKSVEFGTTIADVIGAKQSKRMRVVRSSSVRDIRAKGQARILSKVKSAKDNITKLFKTNGRVSPVISNLFASISPGTIPRVRVVTIFDTPPGGRTRSGAVTSLLYSGHVVEEHIEDFVSIVVEVPSPSSPLQPHATSEPRRTPCSKFFFNELHTIEEEVGNPEMDAKSVHPEPKTLALSNPCPLPTSGSEANYDAMLAAEFATFSFDSDDVREWSDDVEREKQATMDAHFAYVSEALAIPVPKLSAYVSVDISANCAIIDDDELFGNPSPVKTETSETYTSSTGSSLITSIDAEESRLQVSPTIFRGLRRVRGYENLKNLQVITDCSVSFSDLSCLSLDLDPSCSPIAGSKVGMLRRSVGCNDLRRSFYSLAPGRCQIPSRDSSRAASKNWPLSSWGLEDPIFSTRDFTTRPRGTHLFM